MPVQSKYAVKIVGEEFELALPSGNTCLVKKAGPEELISADVLDSVDSLTGLVNDEHVERVTKGKAKSQQKSEAKAVRELLKDKPRWEQLMGLLNKVTAHCVVQPSVSLPPEDGQREPGVLYADKVDLADKVAIFTACLGGSVQQLAAMTNFRSEPTADVGDLGAGQNVLDKAKRAAGGK